MWPNKLKRIEGKFFCTPVNLKGGVREMDSFGVIVPLKYSTESLEFEKELIDLFIKYELMKEGQTYEDIDVF